MLCIISHIAQQSNYMIFFWPWQEGAQGFGCVTITDQAATVIMRLCQCMRAG